MGLFNKLFNSSSKNEIERELPWNELTSLTQLEDIKEKSLLKTQLIFKHSTRCGVSRMVKNQFLKDYNFTEKDFDLYYLDLIEYRAISNEIANIFQVYHESPQLLVVKKGTAVANKSHGAINDLDLKGYL